MQYAACAIPKAAVIAVVRRLDRSDVFIADRASPANVLLGPERDRMFVQSKPDVRHHPRPASVAVEERMDSHGLVMQSHRLVEQRNSALGPDG
jgi:hypothetical protein